MAAFVHERKDQTRQLRELAVDQPVRSEMHDAVLSEPLAGGHRPALLESERFESFTITRQGDDRFRLAPRRAKPVQSRESRSLGRVLQLNAIDLNPIRVSFGSPCNTWIVVIKYGIGKHGDLPGGRRATSLLAP